MTPDLFAAVDQYLAGLLVGPDDVLDAAQRSADAAGLPAISVSPTQGKLLHLLARLCGARRILEIGTLAGYSTIWLARALPLGGRVLTLEIDPRHADIARANFERAGLADLIELRLGPAIETLGRLADERAGPFDLIFIDADKASTPRYFESAIQLSRPGTLIIVDNVVRGGRVIDADSTDEAIIGTREFLRMLSTDRRVTATAVQTVGAKGYDGFALAVVNPDERTSK